MRLASVEIKNFRRIKDINFRIPAAGHLPGSADFVTLIGPNNVGKSSVLEAIRVMCPGSSSPGGNLRHFPFRDDTSEIQIAFTMDSLSPEDLTNDYVARCAHGNQLLVRQTWKIADGRIKCEHETFSKDQELDKDINDLSVTEMKKDPRTAPVIQDMMDKGINVPPRKNATFLRYLWKHAHSMGCDFAKESEEGEWGNHVGLSSITDAHFLPRVLYVPAIKEARDETNSGTKNSSIKQILDLLFEAYLSNRREIENLRSAMEAIRELFSPERRNKSIGFYEKEMAKVLGQLIDLEPRFDFEPPDLTLDLVKATRLKVLNGEFESDPEDQGHGAQRAIIVMLLQILDRVEAARNEKHEQKPLVILIEEPEIYLHPHTILKMRKVLTDLAKQPHITVICTSHSPFFVDIADRHEGMLLCEDHGQELKITQRSEDLYGEETEARERMRMLLDFNPAVASAFFTRRVTLVEGDTEVAALMALRSKLTELGCDEARCTHELNETTIVDCDGKSTISAFQGVLNAFDIKYRVVHDSDIRDKHKVVEKTDETNKKQETINKKILSLLGHEDCRVRIHKPTFEPHMFGEEAKSDKAFNTWKRIRKISFDEVALGAKNQWKEFFAFCTHVEVDMLSIPLAGEEGLSGFSIDGDPEDNTSTLVRQNRRDELDSVIMPKMDVQNMNPLKLAAGVSRLPEADLRTHFTLKDGRYLGKICGESMSETLLDGDLVVLEPCNQSLLPIGQKEDLPNGYSYAEFSKLIEDGQIYLLAVNDDYDEECYTLKRVRIRDYGESWIMYIEADNPETSWGDRGRFVVRDTDSVHFAAKLSGLVELEED